MRIHPTQRDVRRGRRGLCRHRSLRARYPLGVVVNRPDTSQQDSYDTVAYDSLIATGDPSSPCEVGDGIAEDVITFTSQAKETDWLHQNDLAQSAGEFGGGVRGPGRRAS